MKKLLILAISCLIPLTMSYAETIEKSMTIMCGFDAQILKKEAFTKFGESSSFIDLIETVDGVRTILEVMTNLRTRTSTVIIYERDGTACILGVGKDYKQGKSKENDM